MALATATVEPSSTSVVTTIVSESSVPGSTQLILFTTAITSGMTGLNTASGDSSLAPVMSWSHLATYLQRQPAPETRLSFSLLLLWGFCL